MIDLPFLFILLLHHIRMCSMQARVQLQLNCNCAMVKRTFDSAINYVLASGQARMCIGSSVGSDERQM